MLPEVGSTIVPPGLSFPSRSAASIIASPIRSLTEPPGFRNSSFARIVPGTSREIRSSRTIGVDADQVEDGRVLARHRGGSVSRRYASAVHRASAAGASSSRRISASVAMRPATAIPTMTQNAHCAAARERLRERDAPRDEVR